MVGGVADWFAVTALFRHPLGLPIPHTALIVERKDQFAATLGQFVQENFLSGDILSERIQSAHLVPRLAAWLADEANAARFAGRTADVVVTVAENLRDEDVQRVLTAELTRAIDAIEVAPLAGRALRVIIAGGHHTEFFDAILSAADGYLAGHYAELRDLFEAESPRWVPDGLYRRVFDRMYTRLRQRLVAMAADPGDQTRQQFEAWIAGFPTASKPTRSCVSAASALSATSWAAPPCGTGPPRCGRKPRRSCGARRLTRSLSCAAGLADALAAAGRRLGSDRRLQEGLDRMVESGARALADQFHDELAGLVTGTIQRWDAAETSSSWNCSSGAICSTSVSTARWSAALGLILHAIVLALS